jgi:hypothetical protein
VVAVTILWHRDEDVMNVDEDVVDEQGWKKVKSP